MLCCRLQNNTVTYGANHSKISQLIKGELKKMEKHHKLIHTTTIPIRWGDMDAYGHVNNTIYFRYMEQARCEWLEGLGYKVAPEGHAPVIINAACTFMIPMTYPGTVEVRTFAGELGRSSVVTSYEMRIVGDETVYAQGSAKIVWMDTATGKSVPIPDDLRALVS
ncbi:MAG TPA: thioesterase family protein [Azospira sp.]|nr:thioesterase family protein [Azospira sp.]HNN07341.1 thioesterase family protein [Azospira sp.]